MRCAYCALRRCRTGGPNLNRFMWRVAPPWRVRVQPVGRNKRSALRHRRECGVRPMSLALPVFLAASVFCDGAAQCAALIARCGGVEPAGPNLKRFMWRVAVPPWRVRVQPVGRNKRSALRHRRECGVGPMSLALPVFLAASVFCDGAAQCAALIARWGGVEPAGPNLKRFMWRVAVPPWRVRVQPVGRNKRSALRHRRECGVGPMSLALPVFLAASVFCDGAAQCAALIARCGGVEPAGPNLNRFMWRVAVPPWRVRVQPVGRNKRSALRRRREGGVRPMSLPLPVFPAASVFCDGAAQCAALIAPYGGVEPAGPNLNRFMWRVAPPWRVRVQPVGRNKRSALRRRREGGVRPMCLPLPVFVAASVFCDGGRNALRLLRPTAVSNRAGPNLNRFMWRVAVPPWRVRVQPVGRNKRSALRHRRECGVRPMSLALPVFLAASVFCDGAAQCAALIARCGGVEPAGPNLNRFMWRVAVPPWRVRVQSYNQNENILDNR